MDEPAVQALIDATVATVVVAALAAAATPPVVVPVAAPVIPAGFSLFPGGSSLDPWDFTQGSGRKTFMDAVAPTDPIFTGDKTKLSYWLGKMKAQALMHGYGANLLVPLSDGTIANMTEHFGQLTRDNATDFAMTFLAHGTKMAQGDYMLSVMIFNSIDQTMTSKLQLQKEFYNLTAHGSIVCSGIKLLHELIQTVFVLNQPEQTLLETQLLDLLPIMAKHSDNALEFNVEVRSIVDQLVNAGAAPQNIMAQLIKAYKSVKDKQFATYFNEQISLYNHGQVTITSDALMELMRVEYMMLENAGEWNQQTPEELMIVAMYAAYEVQALVAAAAPSTNKGKNQNKTATTPAKWVWKLIAPKPGESEDKKFSGKDYIHYPHHGDTQWVLAKNNGVVHRGGCTKAAVALALSATIPLVVVPPPAGPAALTPQSTQAEVNYAAALTALMFSRAPQGAADVGTESD